MIKKLFEENTKISEILSKENLDKIVLKSEVGSYIDSNKKNIFYKKIEELLTYESKNKVTLILRGEDRTQKLLNGYLTNIYLIKMVRLIRITL